jgi:ribonuclease-3
MTEDIGEDGALEHRLGYEFGDRTLLEAALTHSSALPAGTVRAGEQLEFLGDAVLGVVIADLLLTAFPHLDEGALSKRRATLVRAPTLAEKARALGIGSALRLSRGEDRGGGREKASILASTYEAVLGAVYRDGGFERARAVITRQFTDDLARGGMVGAPDWKTIFQERVQAAHRIVPEYRVTAEEGPAHARVFTAAVWVGDRCIASGQGTSKRDAEQQAARAALEASDGPSDSPERQIE